MASTPSMPSRNGSPSRSRKMREHDRRAGQHDDEDDQPRDDAGPRVLVDDRRRIEIAARFPRHSPHASGDSRPRRGRLNHILHGAERPWRKMPSEIRHCIALHAVRCDALETQLAVAGSRGLASALWTRCGEASMLRLVGRAWPVRICPRGAVDAARAGPPRHRAGHRPHRPHPDLRHLRGRRPQPQDAACRHGRHRRRQPSPAGAGAPRRHRASAPDRRPDRRRGRARHPAACRDAPAGPAGDPSGRRCSRPRARARPSRRSRRAPNSAGRRRSSLRCGPSSGSSRSPRQAHHRRRQRGLPPGRRWRAGTGAHAAGHRRSPISRRRPGRRRQLRRPRRVAAPKPRPAGFRKASQQSISTVEPPRRSRK